ncbi:MAG: hypothetical protein AB1918_07770, partial [Pseudomonadota bacterium]
MLTLRFSGGRGLDAQVVKLATWSWCSHVDFVLPDGRLLGAVPGRGVCIRDVELDDARVECYAVPALLSDAPVTVAPPQHPGPIVGLAFLVHG